MDTNLLHASSQTYIPSPQIFAAHRHAYDSIPSISTLAVYPPPPHPPIKSEDFPSWCTSPADTFLRPEPVSHPSPQTHYHHSPPPYYHSIQPHPCPQQHLLTPMSRIDIKVEKSIQKKVSRKTDWPPPPPRTPHLPAEKNSALKAAKIAAECEDLGPDTTERFRCHFQGCDKYFQRRYNLKVHVRKHTQETPYTCSEPGCGKKFKWRSSMSHHLKAHKRHTNSQSEGDKTELRDGKKTQGECMRNARSVASWMTSGPTSGVTSCSGNGRPSLEYVSGQKGADKLRRMGNRLLPTSPISGTNERFGTFGMENTSDGRVAFAQAGGCDVGGGEDVGMEELSFAGEPVGGMIFDNVMHNSLMDGCHAQSL